MRPVLTGRNLFPVSQALAPLGSPPRMDDAMGVIRANRGLLPSVASTPIGPMNESCAYALERAPFFPDFSVFRYGSAVVKTLAVAPPLVVVVVGALLPKTDLASTQYILTTGALAAAAASPLLALLPQFDWRSLSDRWAPERKLARHLPAHMMWALAAAIAAHPKASLPEGQNQKLVVARLLERSFLSRLEQGGAEFSDPGLSAQLIEVFLVLGNRRIADAISAVGLASRISDQPYLPDMVRQALQGDVVALRKVHSYHRESRGFRAGYQNDALTDEQRAQLGMGDDSKPMLGRSMAGGYRAEGVGAGSASVPVRQAARQASAAVTEAMPMPVALERLAARLIDLNPELALELGGSEHRLALTPNYRAPLPPIVANWPEVKSRFGKVFSVVFIGVCVCLVASGSNGGTFLASIGEFLIDRILGPLGDQSPREAWAAKILALSAIAATSSAFLPQLASGAIGRLAAARNRRANTVGEKARHILAPPVLTRIARSIAEREDARLPRGAERLALISTFTPSLSDDDRFPPTSERA